MDSPSSTPASGRVRSKRRSAKRSGGMLCMSERQTKAYLLARDAVRRIQRSSLLVQDARSVGGAKST